MLPRLAASSLRAAALSRAPRAAVPWRAGPAALPILWMRGMAKDNGPKPPRFSSPTAAGQGQGQPKQSTAQSSRFSPPSPSSSQAQPPKPDPSTDAPPTDAESPPPEQQIPVSSLPDLTQGIPSTLEYETTGATNRSALAPVDEETASAGGRGKGDLPASAYISSSERRRQRLANYLFGITFGTIVAGTVYSGRNWDDEDEKRHPEVPNGWGLKLWWDRSRTRTKELLTYYHEPAFEKLLPDPDPVFGRPYTLCISLEDMLVHSEWSREHGWRVAKRPGADYFLHYLSQYYELVLFTSVPFAIGEPLVRKLDPYRFIVYPLFREATKYKEGEIVKDLSYLNRDLSKVIILDTDPAHVSAQPENAIVLPKWTGDVKDTDLVALIPFLEYISIMQVGDVRKILKSFEGKHIPTEFARREAIARAEFQKQLEEKKRSHPHRGETGIGGLGRLLGLKPNNLSLMVPPEGELNPAEAFAQGKMLQDIARERGQRTYEMMEKEIQENGEKWLKEEAALQEKAQQEAMQSMKNSFVGWFVKDQEKPPSPSDENKKQ